MNGLDAAIIVADLLGELEIPYMLVGSFASNFYGIPRLTQDADFVVEIGAHPIGELAHRLGPSFRLVPQMSFEPFTGTTRYEFLLPEIPFRIELFLLSQDPYDRERFGRRQTLALEGRPISVLTAEDVIITKLRWARSKDKEDIRDVIAAQGDDQIDWDYVHFWCECHETRSLLDEIRRSIPPI